jgi:hypothetical protein
VDGQVTVVTVVHAPACHLCDDAVEVLGGVTARYPLRVEVVELESPEGRRLTAEHRPAMNPLVLVDGARFSAGRLPRRKLEKLLAERARRAPSGVR